MNTPMKESKINKLILPKKMAQSTPKPNWYQKQHALSKKSDKFLRKVNKLPINDIDDFYVTYNHINKLPVNESFRDWIECRLHELRASATPSEVNIYNYLRSQKIPFIFQAPFVICGKVFFSDFYLPEDKVIIEVDGGYHDSYTQHNKDKFRDLCFDGVRIKTIRISNESTKHPRKIRIELSEYLDNLKK
jgi:very-short-patch-repair endonuclease